MFRFSHIKLCCVLQFLRHHSQSSSYSTSAQPVLQQTVFLLKWGVCSPGPQVWPTEGLCRRLRWERMRWDNCHLKQVLWKFNIRMCLHFLSSLQWTASCLRGQHGAPAVCPVVLVLCFGRGTFWGRQFPEAPAVELSSTAAPVFLVHVQVPGANI